MFSYLYFKFRHGSYLRGEHGIKKFAEMCMGQLIRKVTKKSAFYREMNENLLVEKANLRLREEELYEQPMLSAGEFFSVRRRLWANAFIVSAVIAAAIFVNFISVTALIDTGAEVSTFVRWLVASLLAVVLTGGGLVVTERLIEVLIPHRTSQYQDGTPVAVLWGFLLSAIELSILGLAEARADQLSGSTESTVLYYAFVIGAMMLPIVAGAIRWDAVRHIDVYKTTRAHRQIDSRMAQIDSILRQNEEYESNFYKIKSIAYWDLLNNFKTYKDLYNERHDLVESLGGHFAQTYDTFQTEAYKRYSSDIRDISSKSMRKLATSERVTGSKVGQTAGGKLSRSGGVQTPVPVIGSAKNGGSDGTTQEADLYLSPKPIR